MYWNRFEKPEGLYLLYLAFFNFLSSFVNLTVITSDFSYFYSHSFPLSWPDTLPFSCNQLPKSKSWFWQLIIKLWVLNWCTGFCVCFLSNFNCIPCTLLNLILYCDKNIYYWVPDRFIWFLINKIFIFYLLISFLVLEISQLMYCFKVSFIATFSSLFWIVKSEFTF